MVFKGLEAREGGSTCEELVRDLALVLVLLTVEAIVSVARLVCCGWSAGQQLMVCPGLL